MRAFLIFSAVTPDAAACLRRSRAKKRLRAVGRVAAMVAIMLFNELLNSSGLVDLILRAPRATA